jgi:D-glycero-D-manno-heptose 1,7-bisphosphate phosphatase
MVIVITNQSGVARGYFPESILADIHQRLRAELARFCARVDAIYYCPHHPEGILEEYRSECRCRKPGIGLLERAAQEHNLELASSFIVGDKYLDVETGFRAGGRSILVLTGYGNEEYMRQKKVWPLQPDYVAADLGVAVDWILAQVEDAARGHARQAGTTQRKNNRK